MAFRTQPVRYYRMNQTTETLQCLLYYQLVKQSPQSKLVRMIVLDMSRRSVLCILKNGRQGLYCTHIEPEFCSSL
jgi:hypothetical protein